MTSTRQAPAIKGGRYEELEFVFSRTMTRVPTAEEEQRLSQEMWQRRRRVRLTVLWLEHPELFRGVPKTPSIHREPLSSESRSPSALRTTCSENFCRASYLRLVP